MRNRLLLLLSFLSCLASHYVYATPKVTVGVEQLFQGKQIKVLQGKKIGLCTNHTAVDHKLTSSIELIANGQQKHNYTLKALFAPEHGLDGAVHAAKAVKHETLNGIPVYSLHGTTRRATKQMLKGLDLIVYDIQDIGSRSYTYISTLFYLMEEAAKHNIEIVVCDRPNPINGVTIDGPMLEDEWRSFVGYIDVPYCHGMTVGELATYFNEHYNVGCKLTVVPMKGWKRTMTFAETGLPWIPTSPQIPESDSPLYYPTTGILGELQIISIGIGYTLPFKLVGAPFIDEDKLAHHLNAQNMPGVYFHPFSYKPFFGRYAREFCNGALIVVTDPLTYKPVSTQYAILGVFKNLYPKQFKQGIARTKHRREMFCKVNGTEEILNILTKKRYIIWALRGVHQERRKAFLKTRKRYLLKEYTLR